MHVLGAATWLHHLSTTGLAATAVSLHGNIPALGYTSNNMTFAAAKPDIVSISLHFPPRMIMSHGSWELVTGETKQCFK